MPLSDKARAVLGILRAGAEIVTAAAACTAPVVNAFPNAVLNYLSAGVGGVSGLDAMKRIYDARRDVGNCAGNADLYHPVDADVATGSRMQAIGEILRSIIEISAGAAAFAAPFLNVFPIAMLNDLVAGFGVSAVIDALDRIWDAREDAFYLECCDVDFQDPITYGNFARQPQTASGPKPAKQPIPPLAPVNTQEERDDERRPLVPAGNLSFV